MCTLSIIVPVYNVEKYLAKCLDSLIKQTLKDIEIILVDDGSTDKSGEICEQYAQKDKRITVLHKKNGGLSDARNSGINISNGKYIAFIDSDDWVDTKMFEILYNLANKFDADIVQGGYIEVYNEEEKIIDDIKNEINIYNGNQMLERLCDKRMVKDVIICNKLYRRKLFDNIRFPKGKLHEDEFTTYKLFHSAKTIVDTNLIIYYYRQREGSIMNSHFNIKRMDAIEAWKERKKYLKNWGLKNLADKTDDNICRYLKKFYVEVSRSDLENKREILKNLRQEMKNNYISYIKNKEITFRGKLTLTLCILSENTFLKIYKI